MRLSILQKFILLECLNSKTGRISRRHLLRFYDKIYYIKDKHCIKKRERPKEKFITKIITKSIERLINKDLLVGFGERTKTRWFIREIKLSLRGRKEVQKLLGEQLKIKFKNKKIKK